MATTIFQDLGLLVEDQIGSFAADVSTKLIVEISPVIAAGVSLYFFLKAYSFMMGMGNDRVVDVFMTGVKVAVVSFFSLQAGNFVQYAIGSIQALEPLLLSSFPDAPSNSWAAVDGIWNSAQRAIDALQTIYGDTSFRDGMGYLIIVIVALVIITIIGVFMTSAAVGVVLTTKVALVLVLGFGPLFISLLMFPWTRSWFDGWLKSCVTYVVTLVMMAMVVAFFTNLFDGAVNRVVAAQQQGAAFVGLWVQIAIFGIIGLTAAYVIRMVPSFAAGLTGGVALQAVGMGMMANSAWRTGSGMAGSLAAGVGMATGSSGLTKWGRAAMGPQGFNAPGHAALGSAAMAAGAAYGIGRAGGIKPYILALRAAHEKERRRNAAATNN